MVHVLFLCLGNICRSPMAEAVFKQMVEAEGLADHISVDSAGTSAWHVGEMAHHGTRRVLERHGIRYTGRAHQISSSDVAGNSTIIAMSQDNVEDFRRRFGEYERLYRLLDFAPDVDVFDVPDPYYSGNFEAVYELVEAGCHGLLEFIRLEEEV